MRDALQEIVDKLSRELSRSILVDDPSLKLLAHSPLVGGEDRVRVEAILNRCTSPEVASAHFRQGIATTVAPLRTRAQPKLGLEARLCVPLRRRGSLLGFLWVIDPDHSLTDADVDVATATSDTMADLLHRNELSAEAEERREVRVVRALVGDDTVAGRAAAEEAWELGVFPRGGSLAAVVLSLDSRRADSLAVAELKRASEPLRGSIPDHAVLTPLDGRMVVVSWHPACGNGLEGWPDIDRVHARVDEALPPETRPLLYTGGGSPVDRLEEVRRSFEEAAHAALVQSRLAGSRRAARWSELGVYRLLLHLPIDSLDAGRFPNELRCLRAHDAAGTLGHTLERYLDLGCDARRTAEDLYVHRTTLYYRLRRIEEITGCDLANGETRLELHLGLKLARLAGMRTWRDDDPATGPAASTTVE